MLDRNDPYRPPEAKIDADLPQERLPVEFAGKWRRFFNFLIDYTCLKIFWTIMAMLVIAWLSMQGESPEVAYRHYMDMPKGFKYLYTTSSISIYYLLMESAFGLTVGKLVTGTRIVDEQGGRPTFGQIVGRTLCRMIPFEPFSLLFAGSGEARGWHDSIPRTYVVRKR